MKEHIIEYKDFECPEETKEEKKMEYHMALQKARLLSAIRNLNLFILQ